jgi:NADPH-dependent glutamate synthase beta subunit-like oxidoreductase
MTKPKYQVVVPNTQTYRDMILCQAACPVNTDARGYVISMSQGNLEEGYQISHNPNPLSSMCGAICGAPCETACRRGDLDKPVAIRPIKHVLTKQFGPEVINRPPTNLKIWLN